MKIFAMLLLATLCLTGCSATSLGDRAVVKAVYLDHTEEGYAASIVVYGCEPTTDAASAEGKAAIYSGVGDDVPQALAQAEQQQTKEPFYAQNGLLLLGRGCREKDPAPILSYFGEEDASRKDLAVYLTELSPEEFQQCEKGISDVIREAERLAASSGGRGAFGIHEAKCEDGFSGLLPVLRFSEESSSATVRSAVLFERGVPCASVEGAALQLASLLLGKTSELTMEITQGEERLEVAVKGATVRKNMSGSPAEGVLELELSGTIVSLTWGGKSVYARESKQASEEVNRFVEKLFYELVQITFERKNDIFGLSWWMKEQSSTQTAQLERSGELYDPGRLSFSCHLRYE